MAVPLRTSSVLVGSSMVERAPGPAAAVAVVRSWEGRRPRAGPAGAGRRPRARHAYLAYADHARWELVRAAGVDLDALAAAGLGPVNLETTVRFRRELRAGDAVAVSTTFGHGTGKTGRARQELHRVSDGELVAEVDSVTGLLDLRARRLVPDSGSHLRRFVTDPGPIGL